MDRDFLTERLEVNGFDREHIDALLDQYFSLPLTLPIDDDDEPVKRVSEVLTKNGYTTYESCSGHVDDFEKLPYILFYVKSLNHLKPLSAIFGHEIEGITNLIWGVELYTNGLEEKKVLFEMAPKIYLPETIVDVRPLIPTIHQDFDLIGLVVMDYFNQRTKK